MIPSFTALVASVAAFIGKRGGSGTAYVTPHMQFSSSIGVLGCKINTNRAAYWPGSPSCDDICVKLSYNGRSEYLLRVDSSQGAYDISFDAYSQLVAGHTALGDPSAYGGGFTMNYETVHPSNCASLMEGGKLALSAPNANNFLVQCVVNQPSSWVAKNYVLYNIFDSQCKVGWNEQCTAPNFAAGFNQATCPHALGDNSNTLDVSLRVQDINMQGQEVAA